MKVGLLKIEKGKTAKYRVTLLEMPNWLERLLRSKKRKVQLEGNSTVWYYYPSGTRARTETECLIVQFIK